MYYIFSNIKNFVILINIMFQLIKQGVTFSPLVKKFGQTEFLDPGFSPGDKFDKLGEIAISYKIRIVELANIAVNTYGMISYSVLKNLKIF